MAYLTVDSDGTEKIFEYYPKKLKLIWFTLNIDDPMCIYLPKGTIKKITGKDLTFDDDPIELEAD